MSSSNAPYTFQHTTLGLLKGRLRTHSIISPTAETGQFRSSPFATVPARFKLAKPIDHIPGNCDSRSHTDFTQWGHACPQIEQPRDAGGGSLGEDDVRQYDEFACLNCTITAPKKALEGDLKALPVMVYVHGGAFVEGCGNIAASHDTGRMMALSVEEGIPVIIVSLHYRLNWFGFFTCTDLLDKAQINVGFQWVLRQTSGFGGDPSNITAFGESGGSISLMHHLCAPKPLFHRAVLQSGIVGTPNGDIGQHDQLCKKLLEYLDIEETTPQARLKALRAAAVDRLVQAVNDLQAAPAFPYTAQEDAFYTDGPPNWSTIAKQVGNNHWCKEIVLGDSFFESFFLINCLLQRDEKVGFLKTLSGFLQSFSDDCLHSTLH